MSSEAREGHEVPGALASPRAPRRGRADERWLENRPSSGWFRRVDLRELWAHRELALFLALRDLKLRYKQTFFGVAWALIQPLAGVAIFSIVFGRLADLPSDGIPYPVFVYGGLAVWAYFSSGVDAAAQSLVDKSSALVTKVYFPRLLAPLAAVLPALLDLVLSLAIVAVFMAIYGVVPNAAVLLLPLWLLALVAVTLGVGVWLSALNVQYRDVRHALGFVTQVWLFASPVVYPSSLVDGGWRYVYALNPMAGVIDGFRWSLLGGPSPSAFVSVSLAMGLLLLVSGVLYFAKVERGFADTI